MENLADELQAIADEPESDPVEDFRAAGQRLVDALRDQFADGQAESLYSLQTASAQLRKHTEAITSTTAALLDSLRARTAEIRSAATASSQGLADAATQHSTAVAGALSEHQSALAALVSETTGSVERSVSTSVTALQNAVREVTERGSEQTTQQIAALTSALNEHQSALATMVSGTTGSVERTASAAVAAMENAVQTVINHGSSETTQQIAALTVALGEHQSALAALVSNSSASVERNVRALEDSVREVVARTTAEVSEALRQILADTHASIGEQLAAEVDASSAELRGASQDHAQTIASQLEVTSNHLTALYEAAASRAEDARQGLEWVAQQGAEQLTAAATALQQHRIETEEGIAGSGQAMADRLVESRTALVETGEVVTNRLLAGAESAAVLLRETVEGLLAHADAARAELDAAMVSARKAAEEELAVLRKQIQAAERREEAVAERLQKHVEDLVERTQADVTQSLNHLRGVADALLERDAQLEKRRADEFARVLQIVLSESGASTRRLRDRIFRGMESAKAAPPMASTPEPTVSTPPARRVSRPAPQLQPEAAARAEGPEAPAPAPKPAKKAAAKPPVKKAPATVKKAPAKKAPTAKKAPAKKAPPVPDAAREPQPDPKQSSTDLPETIPVQEEKA